MRRRPAGVSIALLLGWSILACEPSGGKVESGVAATAEAAAPSDSGVVDLRPGEDQYTLAHLDVGVLAIRLDTIEASEGGAIVKLEIGNTTGAGLEDLSATVQWGPLDAGGTPQVAPERTREAPLASLVAAGSWTRTSFTFADVPPGEMGFVRLSNLGYARLRLK